MNTSEDLLRQLLEATDREDWSGREAMLTPDCEWVTPIGATHSPVEASAYSAQFVTAFPGSRHEVETLAATGSIVVAEGEWVATHSGPLPTPAGVVPATGRTVRIPFVSVARPDDGLMRSVHIYFDQMGFMAQLGLLPEPQPV